MYSDLCRHSLGFGFTVDRWHLLWQRGGNLERNTDSRDTCDLAPVITMYSISLIHVCPGPQREECLLESEHWDFLWWGGQRPGEQLKEGFPRQHLLQSWKRMDTRWNRFNIRLLSSRLWRTVRRCWNATKFYRKSQFAALAKQYIVSQVWFDWFLKKNKNTSYLKLVNNLSFF